MTDQRSFAPAFAAWYRPGALHPTWTGKCSVCCAKLTLAPFTLQCQLSLGLCCAMVEAWCAHRSLQSFGGPVSVALGLGCGINCNRLQCIVNKLSLVC